MAPFAVGHSEPYGHKLVIVWKHINNTLYGGMDTFTFSLSSMYGTALVSPILDHKLSIHPGYYDHCFTIFTNSASLFGGGGGGGGRMFILVFMSLSRKISDAPPHPFSARDQQLHAEPHGQRQLYLLWESESAHFDVPRISGVLFVWLIDLAFRCGTRARID